MLRSDDDIAERVFCFQEHTLPVKPSCIRILRRRSQKSLSTGMQWHLLLKKPYHHRWSQQIDYSTL
jgi:hypothetical protein